MDVGRVITALLVIVPFGLLLAWNLTRTADRMPRQLWAGVPPAGGTVECRVRGYYRAVTLTMAVAFPVLGVVMVVGVLVSRMHDGVAVAVFVAGWTAGAVVASRWLLFREPMWLRLTADDVLEVHGTRWAPVLHIPVAEITSVKSTPIDKYVSFSAGPQRVRMPKDAHGLREFMVELRRRNPAVEFQGGWPPRSSVWHRG